MAKFVPPGFDAARVSDGIYKAMGFGEPSRAADKATFFFPKTSEYAPGTVVDDDQVPFDPALRPTVSSLPQKTVACAIEFFDRTDRAETFGVVAPSRIQITLLDPEYQEISGFSFVVAGGDKYVYHSTEPPVALATIDVWTVWCNSEDES